MSDELHAVRSWLGTLFWLGATALAVFFGGCWVLFVVVERLLAAGQTSPSPFDDFGLWFFLLPVIVVGVFSLLFLLQTRRALWLRALPTFICIVTGIVGGIVEYQHQQHPWVGFFWHKPEFDAVVALAEQDALPVNKEGYAPLPPAYRAVTVVESIYISKTATVTTLYFIAGWDMYSAYTWGYIYRSDGSEPSVLSPCEKWVMLEPAVPNWYVCTRGDSEMYELTRPQPVP